MLRRDEAAARQLQAPEKKRMYSTLWFGLRTRIYAPYESSCGALLQPELGIKRKYGQSMRRDEMKTKQLAMVAASVFLAGATTVGGATMFGQKPNHPLNGTQ